LGLDRFHPVLSGLVIVHMTICVVRAFALVSVTIDPILGMLIRGITIDIDLKLFVGHFGC
jgi:hypothetical protein